MERLYAHFITKQFYFFTLIKKLSKIKNKCFNPVPKTRRQLPNKPTQHCDFTMIISTHVDVVLGLGRHIAWNHLLYDI